MSKTSAKEISLELVPASVSSVTSVVSLGVHAERITAYHDGVLRSFGQQMGYAFLCGLELNTVKTQLPHGQFEKWTAENLPQLPHTTAQRYRHFAEALQKHSHTLANLVHQAPLLIADGQLSEAHRTELMDAVHAVTDGKTLTEMYRDLGVIRQPKHQKDRARSEEKLTAEEAAARRKEESNQFLDLLDADLATAATNAELHVEIETPRLKQSFERALAYTSALRQIFAARGPIKKPKRQKATKVTKKGKS